MINLILFLMLLTIFFTLMPKTENKVVDNIIFPLFAVSMGTLTVLLIILLSLAKVLVLFHG